MQFKSILDIYNIGGDDSTSTRRTRSKIEEGTHGSWNWEEVLKQNPETVARNNRDEKDEEEQKVREEEIRRRQLEILKNPTPEMCRIMAALKDLQDEKREMSLKDQLIEFNKQRKAELQARFLSQELITAENTPAMEEVRILNKNNNFFLEGGGVKSMIFLIFNYNNLKFHSR